MFMQLAEMDALTIQQYHVGETLYFSPTETALANLTVYWPEPDGTDDERRQLAATVVRIQPQNPNAPRLDIRALLEEYLIADDVISREWLYTLFFAPSRMQAPRTSLRSTATRWRC